MYLLIYCLLLAQTFFGTSAAVSLGRALSPGMDITLSSPRYEVFPVDPQNTAVVQAIQDELYNLTGGYVHRKTEYSNATQAFTDKLISWEIVLRSRDQSEDVAKLDGVASINQQPALTPDLSYDASLDAQDEAKKYAATARNPQDDAEGAKILDFLKSVVVKEPDKIFMIEIDGHVYCWYHLWLDGPALEKVRAHPGIKLVGSPPGRVTLHGKKLSRVSRSASISHRVSSIVKRVVTWRKQGYARDELKSISQPPDVPLIRLDDFVYEESAGRGIYIYILDFGMSGGVKNNQGDVELRHSHLETRQTDEARAAGMLANDDLSGQFGPHSHGIMVASKAVGLKYGVAKEASIVSWQMLPSAGPMELPAGLSDIAKDIRLKGRQRSSIVVVNLGTPKQYQRGEDAFRDVEGVMTFDAVGALFNMGVPVVCASGNDADRGRPNIDEIPAVFEDPSFPVINVGAVDSAGKRAEGRRGPWSQAGPKLTVSAVGAGIELQTKYNGVTEKVDGTSFASPAVAGVIANYMSRFSTGDIPWDDSLNGWDRVKEIKKYIKSKESAYERQPGQPNGPFPVIWNGATDADHQGAGSWWDPIKPNCYGLSKNSYITRDTLSALVSSKFCPEVSKSKQGHYTATYLDGTPETVEVHVQWRGGSQPDWHTCRSSLHQIIDGCDTENTGLNWKGGGEYRENGASYRISPKAIRQAAMDKPRGTCNVSWQVLWMKVTITGAGWLNSGFGHELKDALNDADLAVTEWNFRYGLYHDGREWTVDFRTIVTTEDKIEGAIKKVANYPGFGIECS